MEENDISYIIRGAIFEVYNTLGPGLFESVYVAALCFELEQNGLQIKREVGLPAIYKSEKLDLGFRIDILVNNKVLIEVKSIESILNLHHKQVITYLKLSNLKLGLLVNFNCDNISDNIFRKVNNL